MMKNMNLSAAGYESENDPTLAEIRDGLGKERRELPCKLFYDERGSALFDEICELEEYYPTRTEAGIMSEYAEKMADALGERRLLIELGSGSIRKIRVLLEYLSSPAAYVPVDISREHLIKSAAALARDYPALKIIPVHADYTKSFELPRIKIPWAHRVAYYPGSSIGNFSPQQAREFLERVRDLVGSGGGLLIGVDLKKDRRALEAAYNDKKGVTAEFNLNILRRLNREFGGSFDLAQWAHRAIYNEEAGRVEMYLVSRTNQQAAAAGLNISFKRGEAILTEYSHKYSIADFESLVRGVFRVERVWTDGEQKFSVQYLSAR
ncbi:MAG: L-histidine N(alpha)-methyltransferase [Deltaproteobacteria bacterium]